MSKRFATIISAIFHPMIMPFGCVLIASQFDWYIKGIMPFEQAKLVLLIIFLSTVVFPGINILLLKWYGTISSLEMPQRKERIAPYISSIFFFILGYYLLRKTNIPETIFSILFGGVLALVLIALINFKWKISAHATGAFGLVGTAIGLFVVHNFENLILLSALLLIGGLVMTSRLVLKAHVPSQVYAGAFLGFICLYIPIKMGWFI